jgi:hypothetical protein
MANGQFKPAGQLQVGDRIWTVPGGPSQHTEPGEYEVTDVKRSEESERACLMLDGGARPVYSPRHLVMTPAGWRSVGNLLGGDTVLTVEGERRVLAVVPADPGPVVRITTSASTYITEGGVLNHNLKAQ